MKKIAVTLCLVLLTAMVSAKQQKSVISVQQKAFAAITVTNIETSSHWYQTLFNLKLINDFQSPDGVVKGQVLSNNQLTIELQQHKDALPSSAPAGKPYKALGQFKFGIIINNLDKTVAELKAQNVTIRIPPFTDPGSGTKQAIIADPDGNMIQLIED